MDFDQRLPSQAETLEELSLPATPFLQLNNLTKRFGRTVAVDSVSLDIYEGEFVFLIGPSGCGKTTTLRMVGGYETPSEGEVLIRGQRMTNVPLDKRNIGMVFQSYALFPHKTVWENVEFGLKTRRIPRSEREERVQAALDLVELSGLEKRYPAQLSGGQSQRVALARIIVYEPDILLLDEPLANLDKRLRDAMRIELKKLQEKIGITTLYVTHDQEEALTMGDRIAVMNHGQLLQVGTPSEVYNKPRSHFVATFLGETSSFQGTVENIVGDVAHIKMDDGFRAAVRHHDDIALGDKLTVSIRPERVRLSKVSPSRTENTFAGTVEFVEYLGSQAVYMVRLDSGQAIVEATELIPTGKANLEVDDHVYASWECDQAVYFKD